MKLNNKRLRYDVFSHRANIERFETSSLMFIFSEMIARIFVDECLTFYHFIYLYSYNNLYGTVIYKMTFESP